MNAVARRAGVSKELIYRYFGGAEPFLKTMMQKQDYCPSARYLKGTTEGECPRQRVRDMFLKQIAVLLSNDILREISSWEHFDNNELTNEPTIECEAASLDFLEGCGIAADEDRVSQIALMLVVWPERKRPTRQLAYILKNERISSPARGSPRVPSVWVPPLAGVLYLTIHSNSADSFMGIPLKSEAGWTRLENAIESMCATTMR